MRETKEILTVAATIAKIESLEDKSWKLKVITQELSDEQGAQMVKLNGKFGFMLFSETPIVHEDIPDFDPSQFDTDKSPSKRLRSVIFLYWQGHTDQKTNFDTFYASYVEKLIDSVKSKLD